MPHKSAFFEFRSFFKDLLTFVFFFLFVGNICFGRKIEPNVVLSSLEGEVTSFSLLDDFKVTLDSSAVGKKFSPKSVLMTGKNGKAGLLFSNGALITIKPNSRFYLRKYNQKIVENAGNLKPSEMQEEPSNSELLAHLDFGELIVKAPKLNEGSKMVLSSPLGTAEIKGTMFQLMAVRNPLTGDISGGVNLISGDIAFTDTSGNEVTLVSGQSLVAATGKLGDNLGAQSGGLVDLTSTFGPGLSGSSMPPAIDMLFPPEISEEGEGEGESSSDSSFASGGIFGGGSSGGGWDVVQQIASEVFFEIEASETSSSSISFESMLLAVSVDTPSPRLSSPTAPSILSGSDSPLTPDPFQGAHPNMALKGDDYMQIEMSDQIFADLDPWINATDFLGNDLSAVVSLVNPPDLKIPGTYTLDYEVTDLRGLTTSVSRTVEVIVTPPILQLVPGPHGVSIVNGQEELNFLVQKKYADYPIPDDGPFQILGQTSSVFPSYSAQYHDGRDLTFSVQVLKAELVDYSILGDYEISFVVDDFSLRQVRLPSGDPVTTVRSLKVRVLDNQPPILSVLSGSNRDNPHQVEGVLGTSFADPGISILDNYYSQVEIEQNLGFQSGSVESVFGSVNMDVAGIYELVYQGISDPSGNDAEPISRWVEVFDVTPPELTIYGADPLFVDVNKSDSLFRDPGAFAFDNLDGPIDWETGQISVSIEIINEEGVAVPTDSTIDEIVELAKTQASLNKTFQMIYSFVDAAGNLGTTTRQIVLINSPFDKPFIVDSAPDQNPLIVDVLVLSDPNTGLRRDPNTGRFEPGVTAYKDFGGTLEPKNLTSLVTENEYIGGELGAIDDTVVNFSLRQDAFVDPQGNPDESYKSIIKYVVQDEFGNEATYVREIRIVDRTGPLITLAIGAEGGKNFSYLQAGFPFVDPGYVASDNYDENVTVTSTLIQLSTGKELSVDLVSSIGFTEVGSYEIRYEATDRNGNQASENAQSDTVRTIEVIDTIKPQIAIFTHDFVRNPTLGLTALNDPKELVATPIVDASNPIPDEITTSLASLTGWTGSDFDIEVARTLTTEVDFYVFAESDEILVENHPNPIVQSTDENGRFRYRFSGFYIKDKNTNEVLFEDPGVYARNDSNVPLEFYATLTPYYKPSSNNEVILSYKLNYYVSQQEGGESNQIIAGRTIYIIDQEKPLISLMPETNGIDTFVIIEANRLPTSVDLYTDLHGDSVGLLTSGIVTSSYLELVAVDALDGILTNAIVRTIKDDEGVITISGVPAVLTDNNDQNTVATSIASIIDATILDARYSIEYFVDDIPIDDSISPNRSDTVTRHLIVKDTKAPTIDVNVLESTFLVDILSTANPDVNDNISIATYMLTGLSATDANDYDQDLGTPTIDDPDAANWVVRENANGEMESATYNSKWTLDFTPPFVPGAIYPEIKNANQGYLVEIKVRDQSDNNSSQISRYLQVGDFTPPTITLLGDYEIHDFLRFKSNQSVNVVQQGNLFGQSFPSGTSGENGQNTAFLDQPESSTNPEYNATGFAGGAHRLLIADYDFVEPGVYAEDNNSYFDIKDDYPDLNGNGIGEGHAFTKVGDRQAMNDCSEGPGIIHIYSFFEKNSYTINDWQELMAADTFGFNTALLPPDLNASISPAKIPDVLGEDNSSEPGRVAAYGFEDNKTDLTNFDMTIITIEYRVMDGWDNRSDIITRMVYIYESRQFGDYAFYATPLTDASAGKFEAFYDNGSGDPFLRSNRKDLDGDGVSDFWEIALGTKIDDPNDFPNMNSEDTFKALTQGDDYLNDLRIRLGKLDDSSVLFNHSSGLLDFNSTLGL